MQEELKDKEISETEDIKVGELSEPVKLGLDPLDAADYNVNDGMSGEDDLTEGGYADRDGSAQRQRLLRLASFVLGIVCCIGAGLLCTNVLGIAHIITGRQYDYYKELDGAYGKYYEIMEMIGEDPIAKYEPEELSDAELKKIVAGIGDPYAEYYTADEYEEMQKRYAGDYVGIGIGVVQEDDRIVIKSVFEDTPAADAGMMEEDVIIEVDGREPADVDEAIEMISGDAGTKVTVKVLRGEETLEFTLNRAKIDTDSVGYTVLDGHPDIGYIAIASFIQGTDDEFKLAVRDLKADGCDKFILDLRDNGGGLTDTCIEIADYLLPACRIMSENTKDGKETVYNSKASSADLEMVVLVNENTASASEILTAALQDNDAATVIGSVTYGKGVTQTVHRFADGSAIKITVTEYFRPNGETVNGVGITPDIETEGEEAFDEALKQLEN